MKIKKLSENAVIPKYAKESDAGLDLSSDSFDKILAGQRGLVSTGLAFEIPVGYFGSIRDRSGIAVKNGIHVLAGVIDSGYRGEIKVCLQNLSDRDFEIKIGDRIAQIIIQPILIPEIEEVTELSSSERGDGGFGSTGK